MSAARPGGWGEGSATACPGRLQEPRNVHSGHALPPSIVLPTCAKLVSGKRPGVQMGRGQTGGRCGVKDSRTGWRDRQMDGGEEEDQSWVRLG